MQLFRRRPEPTEEEKAFKIQSIEETMRSWRADMDHRRTNPTDRERAAAVRSAQHRINVLDREIARLTARRDAQLAIVNAGGIMPPRSKTDYPAGVEPPAAETAARIQDRATSRPPGRRGVLVHAGDGSFRIE